MLDVNGTKGPNVWAIDYFGFDIGNNTVKINGLGTNPESAGWLIYKGNMDYLHCKDLSWKGKSKCSK